MMKCKRSGLGGFNPLPLPKQGEIWTGVSPWLCGEPFQSAPLTEARGDSGSATVSLRSSACFNPLPLPKQGEIR